MSPARCATMILELLEVAVQERAYQTAFISCQRRYSGAFEDKESFLFTLDPRRCGETAAREAATHA